MRITIGFSLKFSKKKPDETYPVYARFILNKKRVELTTRIYVTENIWDVAKERVSGKSDQVKTINNRLDKVATRILDVYNQFEAQNKKFDVFDIKNKLRGIKEEHGIIEMFDVYI